MKKEILTHDILINLFKAHEERMKIIITDAIKKELKEIFEKKPHNHNLTEKQCLDKLLERGFIMVNAVLKEKTGVIAYIKKRNVTLPKIIKELEEISNDSSFIDRVIKNNLSNTEAALNTYRSRQKNKK